MSQREARAWRGSRDGPWPTIRIDGELERAESEWLHTNGAGAYAMSTVAMMHTKRQHGMLVAALDPPVGRTVILSHADTSIEIGDRSYKLSTHQFPGIAPTPGYRSLKSFSQDPLPRWIHKLDQGTVQRTLCLVRGHNALILEYLWGGQARAVLNLRPLLPLRPIDSLTEEHGAMAQTVMLRPTGVEIRPDPNLPSILFRHTGVFMGSPDWWRRFEYLADRGEYPSFQEDLWTPGQFEIELVPRHPTYLMVGVGGLPDRAPEELIAEARESLLASDPGADRAPAVRFLSVASEPYRAAVADRPCVIAGYPGLGVYTRDALIGLPGLYLARGDLAGGRELFLSVAKTLRGGLLPLTLPKSGVRRPRPSVDATLWLFYAARALLDAGAFDGESNRDALKTALGALRRVFVRVSRRQAGWVWLSEDGLVSNGAPVPLTWMDAQVDGFPVTPRRGLAIELSALWSKGTETLALMAQRAGDMATAAAAEQACEKTRTAFRRRFWCEETSYPFDCVSELREHADSWVDRSIRPNALLALAVDPDCFEVWQAKAIVQHVRSDLLTTVGIRTLAPSEPAYEGSFSGTREEREGAYHQGTAWPFLVGFYTTCALRVAGDVEQARLELLALIEGVLDNASILGQIPQLSDGDAPFRPRGCPAHAVSVAELLRALIQNLDAGT